MKKTPLTESQEDYLEAILALEENSRVARVSDIAKSLSVKKSSVTAALKNLSERRLVDYAPYAHVTLTSEGMRCARTLSRNHGRLKRFFMEGLGIAPPLADRNACHMEHALDGEVMEKLLNYLEKKK